MRRTAFAIIGALFASTVGGLSQGPPSPPDRGFIEAPARPTVEETQSVQATGDLTGDELPFGGGIIRGVVTVAGTSVPVHGAAVRALISSLDASPVTTVTDSNGGFELRGLAPGRWRVDAARSGFLARSFGQRGRSPEVGTVTLKDRAEVTANIALVPGGIVAGRVFDEFGDPAVGVRVQALELRTSTTGRQWTAAGVPDLTDDTGSFRVYNLAPGDYFISARAPTFQETLMSGGRVNRLVGVSGSGAQIESLLRAAPPTYFPGARDISEAERIELGAGEERAGISFALSNVPGVRVSGRVLNSAGELPGRVGVSIRGEPFVELTVPMPSNPVTADGRFDFVNVAPGSYVITVDAIGVVGPARESAVVRVTVGSEDMTGLTIVIAPPATLYGTIVTSDGTLPNLRGTMIAVTSSIGRVGGMARPTDDGAFQVPGLVGEYRLDVDSLPPEWTLESIEVDGVDVTDTTVTFRSGQPQATVTLTNRLTDLSGVVTINRRPVEAAIAIFPEDQEKWSSRRYVRSLRANEAGTFTLRGLPPHNRYLAAATEYLDTGELQDPAFLEQLRSHATPFSLEHGQPRRLRLTLVERGTIAGR